MRDSVPSASYSSVCNVLRQWNISLIPTYRVYRLYDYFAGILTFDISADLHKAQNYSTVLVKINSLRATGL